MNEPKISIIILNWNGWQDTIKCLESIYLSDYTNYDTIIVDNNSSDKSVEKIKCYCKSINMNIELIENSTNLGFANANNIAIKYAVDQLKANYVFLLNNDTVIDKYCLSELIKVAENDKTVGITGPKIFNYDLNGKSNVVQKYGGIINWWLYPGYHWNFENQDRIIEVDWVSGTALMVRTNLPLYTLSPNYFFGCEDVDICLRIRRLGFKVVAIPTAILWHKGGASRKKRNLLISNMDLIKTNLQFIVKNRCYLLPIYLVQISLLYIYYLMRHLKSLFKKHVSDLHI